MDKRFDFTNGQVSGKSNRILTKMHRRQIDESKHYTQMYNKWVWYDKLVTIFSMLGLAAKIVAFELDVRRFNELNFSGLGVHTEEDLDI